MLTRLNFIEKLLLRFNVLPHPLFDAGSQVASGRALMAGMKLGIVDAIEEKPVDIPTVAQKANVSEHGAKLVLDCLEPIGYVKRNNGQYGLTSTGQKFLTRDSPIRYAT